jgi:hypothetical protein
MLPPAVGVAWAKAMHDHESWLWPVEVENPSMSANTC